MFILISLSRSSSFIGQSDHFLCLPFYGGHTKHYTFSFCDIYERKKQPQDEKCLCSKWKFWSLSMSLVHQGLQMDFLLLLLLKEEASRIECFEEGTWRFGKILVLASHEIETSLLQPVLYVGLFLSWLCRGRKSAGAAVSTSTLSETTTCQNSKITILVFPLC